MGSRQNLRLTAALQALPIDKTYCLEAKDGNAGARAGLLDSPRPPLSLFGALQQRNSSPGGTPMSHFIPPGMVNDVYNEEYSSIRKAHTPLPVLVECDEDPANDSEPSIPSQTLPTPESRARRSSNERRKSTSPLGLEAAKSTSSPAPRDIGEDFAPGSPTAASRLSLPLQHARLSPKPMVDAFVVPAAASDELLHSRASTPVSTAMSSSGIVSSFRSAESGVLSLPSIASRSSGSRPEQGSLRRAPLYAPLPSVVRIHVYM
jgi:hypothetical protein